MKEVVVPDALQAYSVRRAERQGAALEARTVRVAHLAALSSRATSLGASAPSAGVVPMALQRKGGVRCVSVSDERAMEAALRFAGTLMAVICNPQTLRPCGLTMHAVADDEKIVPELATAAALVPGYMPGLLNGLLPPAPQQGPTRVVVFIVCGGTKAYWKDLEEYRETVNSWDREADFVYMDGAVVTV